MRLAAVLAATLILISAVPAAAQTADDALRFTQRAPATGARMTGLAGAGIVGIADQSALVQNPAGLGFFNRSEFTAGLNMLSTVDEALFRTPASRGLVESDLQNTGIGNLSYIYRVPTVQGSLVFGAAFNQVNTYDRRFVYRGDNPTSSITTSFLPFDDEFEIAYDDDGTPFPRFFSTTPELAYLGGAIEFLSNEAEAGNYPFYQAVDPSTTIRQEGDVTEEGRLKELSFGGAVEAVRGLMAGASLNIAFGSYDYRSSLAEIDDMNQNGPSQYEVFLPNETLRGLSEVNYVERLESDLVGVNARFGVSTAVVPSIRLGLALETPTYYNVNENYSRVVTTYFDEGGSLSHGGEAGDAGEGEFEYSISTPWKMGAGVAFAAVGLTLSADAEYVDWSQMRMEASTEEGYFDQVNQDIRDNLEGVVNTHVGLEYNLQDLALRAGIAFQPDPVAEPFVLENGETLDREKTFFSLGLGYTFADQLKLDVAWMQERFNDAFVPYEFVDTPPTVEEDVVRNRFIVGLRYLF